MRYNGLFLVLAGFILSACAAKEIDYEATDNADEVFYAAIECPAERVFVDDGLRVLWNADDRVSIFNRYTYNREYRFGGKDGDNSGEFTLIPQDGFIVGNSLEKVYAVYPYREETRISNDGEMTVTLPAEQGYRENSFGIGANTMISVTEDNQLLFRNLCGYLMLRLYGNNISITSLSVKGNDSEPLAGQAKVVARTDQVPSLTFDESATTELSVHFDTPVLLGDRAESATVFWLVVPPVTFSKGITLTVTDSEGGRFEKTASSSFTIQRNTLSKMAALRVGSPIPGEVTGISLDKTELTLAVGQTAVLQATVRPDDAVDKTVTWTSSAEGIAKVDGEGRITAVSPGKATITAKAGEKTADCRVTVNAYEDEDAPIPFADAKLKEKLLIRFDTNQDGELSYKEAAAVTSMEGAVTGVATIKAITSFDEFQFFTGVSTLPEKYFADWESLSSIVLPASLTYVSKMAFYGCSALKSVVIPEGIERIEDSAFADCSSLPSVILPRTLVSIGDYAFYGCSSLSSILLPENLGRLGVRAFSMSGLTSITIPGTVSEVEEWGFSGCDDLRSVVFSTGVQAIGESAFRQCGSLESVDFCPTITSIEKEAFLKCTSLQSVSLPADIKSIATSVFQDCSGLVSVTLPDHLGYIANGAFFECKSLRSIELPEGVVGIGQGAFGNCESLTTLHLPSSLTSIANYAFSGCSSLQSLAIPENLTSLGERPFEGCVSLASLSVHAGNPLFDSRDQCNAIIKTQPGELILGCKNTVIPKNITSIGAYAFYKCSTLTSILIPGNVSSVGYKAFSYCRKLSSLTISEGVESLGAAAFEYCDSLPSVVIPESVAAIGASAFVSCYGLSYAEVNAINPPEAGGSMFDATNDCPIRVPEGSVDAYKADYYWGKYASRIVGKQ